MAVGARGSTLLVEAPMRVALTAVFLGWLGLFLWLPSCGGCSHGGPTLMVQVAYRDELPGGADGYTAYCEGPTDVWVARTLTPEMLVAMITHELGHARGLPHLPEGIMRANVNPLLEVRPQDAERAAGFGPVTQVVVLDPDLDVATAEAIRQWNEAGSGVLYALQ